MMLELLAAVWLRSETSPFLLPPVPGNPSPLSAVVISNGASVIYPAAGPGGSVQFLKVDYSRKGQSWGRPVGMSVGWWCSPCAPLPAEPPWSHAPPCACKEAAGRSRRCRSTQPAEEQSLSTPGAKETPVGRCLPPHPLLGSFSQINHTPVERMEIITTCFCSPFYFP